MNAINQGTAGLCFALMALGCGTSDRDAADAARDVVEASETNSFDTTPDGTSDADGPDGASDADGPDGQIVTDVWDDVIGRETCSAERIEASGQAVTHYSCVGTGETEVFDCVCGGVERPGAVAADCAQALLGACGVPEGQNYCVEDEVGVCWRERDSEFLACDCGAGTVNAGGGPCAQALFLACATSCDVAGVAVCEKRNHLAFECTCEDGRTGDVRGIQCANTARSFCEPLCTSDEGHCALGADNVSFDCICDGDAAFENLRYEALGHDDCDAALAAHCVPE